MTKKNIYYWGSCYFFHVKKVLKKEIVEVNVQQSGSPVYDDEKKEGDEAQKMAGTSYSELLCRRPW